SSAADFFFQAEDGIRDFHVTGVQTCALPISFLRCINLLENPHQGQIFVAGEELKLKQAKNGELIAADNRQINRLRSEIGFVFQRSEERRVGKECRARRYADRVRETGGGDST